MPITSITSDPSMLTMTVIGEYFVSVERLWEAFADPRQLEKFWGPVEWPATFTRHDMSVGGYSHYYMTGPDGTQSRAWFHFLKVEPLKMFEVEDGFSNADGSRNNEMPVMRMVFNFEPTSKGSRYTLVTHFDDVDAMEKIIGMGMMEGIKSATSQIDAVVADLRSYATNLPAAAQLLNDTQVRVSRVIRGTVPDVWRAHHEPALLKRWLLGPDGWTMPVCQVATAVGESWRNEWESADGTRRFGFEGELLEVAAPHRAVTTERMMDTAGPSTHNVLTLVGVGAGTLLTLVITYPTKELRDMILGTGMVGGMEASYARLEREVLA
ncbi:MAG: SRPBCC family protein [Gemmatimonadota bacterium]